MSTFNISQSSNSSFFLRPGFNHQDVEAHFNLNSHNSSCNADSEFHESDLFSIDSSSASSKPRKVVVVSGSRRSSKVAAAEMEAAASRSVPVSIPEWSVRRMMQQQQLAEGNGIDGDEDDGDRENRVPPHEFLARRRGASLSVHEGAGRTLKGRDMRRVRNAIWKRIGFED